MGRAAIREKHITLARKRARVESTARIDGRSIFIKRYPGKNYKIIMVHVTKKQRAVRDMFADANVLAKEDMTKWNKVRHWERYARKHKKHGAYRAAVSYYYKMIREHKNDLRKENWQAPIEMNNNDRQMATIGIQMRSSSEENIFHWLRFENTKECREALWRLAG